MGDMTIEITEMCSELSSWHHRALGSYSQSVIPGPEWHCTCKGFRYRGKCKHVAQAREEQCSWHGHYDEKQQDPGVCPRCGGPTVTVKVAV